MFFNLRLFSSSAPSRNSTLLKYLVGAGFLATWRTTRRFNGKSYSVLCQAIQQHYVYTPASNLGNETDGVWNCGWAKPFISPIYL